MAFSDLSVISCSTSISKCRIIFTRKLTTLSLDIFAVPKFWTLNAPKMIGDSITCWFSVLDHGIKTILLLFLCELRNILVLHVQHYDTRYLPICGQARISSLVILIGDRWFLEFIIAFAWTFTLATAIATAHIEIKSLVTYHVIS